MEPEPEPQPDCTDGSWIEERTPELRLFREPNGDGPEIVREVLTGKLISTWRRRTPADGDAPFVLVIPKSRMKSDEEKLTLPSRNEWISDE